MTDPTITPAQPLPFNEWITRKGTTVPGPDEYRDYVDYANTELLRNGLYDDQLAAEIEQEVANLAAESGVTADLRARRPDQDFDLLTRRAIETGDDDMGNAVRTYQAVKGSRDIYDDEVEYQRELEEARLAAEPFLDPERVNDARRAALDRGDLPFVVIDQGGDKPPLIQFGPAAADIQTDEDLAAAFDANPDLDRRFIGAVRQKIQPLPGFDAPAWALDRQMDFQAAAARTKVTDTERYRLMVRDIANGNTDAFDRTLADLSTDPAFASFTPDERRNFLMDMAKMQGQPEVDPQNVAASLRTLSTGQVHIPNNVMFNKGYFDQALQAVPEGQHARIKIIREAHMEAVAPEMFKGIAEFSTFTKDDPSDPFRTVFVDFYEQAKAAGKSNGEILDEWMSNPDNHSKFWTRARGLTMGAVSAVTDIPISLAALAGSEGARDILVENQRRESARKQYANLFGDKLGIGYDAANLIAPVGVDLTLAAAAGPTGGATAGLLAAKTGAKAVVKSALRRSLSAETKTLLSQFTRKAAARQATRQGLDTVTTPISTSAVLTLAGRDFAQTVSRSATQATVLGTAFTRSAGSTYASLHATLSNERNADGTPRYTPEQVREIAMGHGLASGAITASVVGAFQFLGAAGVERLLSGGFTPAQARQIHARLQLNPAIAKQYGVSLESPNAMIESAVRNATTNFLRAGVEEGGEEFVDQMAQSVNEALATGERFDVVKATKDALYAGTLGFAMGAGMTGAQRLAGRPLGEDRLQLERRSTLLQLANKFDAHSPNTAAALRAAAAEPPPAPAQEDVPAPPAAGGPEQAPSDAGVAPAPEGQVTPAAPALLENADAEALPPLAEQRTGLPAPDPEIIDIEVEFEDVFNNLPAPAGTPTESLPTDTPTSGDVGTAVQQELPGTEQPRQRTLSGMRDAVNRRLDQMEEDGTGDPTRLTALLGRIEAKMLRDNAEGADAVRARYASAVPGQTVTADAPREVREVMESEQINETETEYDDTDGGRVLGDESTDAGVDPEVLGDAEQSFRPVAGTVQGDADTPIGDEREMSGVQNGESTASVLVQEDLVSGLERWKGDTSDLLIHISDELAGAPIPGSLSGANMRAQAKAIVQALSASPLNPVTLYRGGKRSPQGIQELTSSKNVAQKWAKRYGGTVSEIPPNSVPAFRIGDVIDSATDRLEKGWIVDNDFQTQPRSSLTELDITDIVEPPAPDEQIVANVAAAPAPELAIETPRIRKTVKRKLKGKGIDADGMTDVELAAQVTMGAATETARGTTFDDVKIKFGGVRASRATLSPTFDFRQGVMGSVDSKVHRLGLEDIELGRGSFFDGKWKEYPFVSVKPYSDPVKTFQFNSDAEANRFYEYLQAVNDSRTAPSKQPPTPSTPAPLQPGDPITFTANIPGVMTPTQGVVDSIKPDGSIVARVGRTKYPNAQIVGDERQQPAVSNTPVARDLQRLGIQDGSAAFLRNVIERGPKDYKIIARILSAFTLPNPTLVDLPDANYAGAFVASTRQILINVARRGPRGPVDTVMHELIHAALEDSLRNPTDAQRKILNRLERIRQTVMKRAEELGNRDVNYGLSSMDEFFTHFLTSPEFQRQIGAMTPKGQRNWVEVILDALRSLFGAKLKTEADKQIETIWNDMIRFTESAAAEQTYGLSRMDQLRMQPADLRDLSRFKELTEMDSLTPEQEAELVRLQPAPQATGPFYSQLQRTVATKVPARATPDQIMATVKAAGVKAEEIKWSGIEQALGSLAVDGKVEKAALMKYLGEEGSVRFEEVVMGGKPQRMVKDIPVSEWAREAMPEQYAQWENATDPEDKAFLTQLIRREHQWRAEAEAPAKMAGDPKFGQYVLPGGDNYREVVLAMPDAGDADAVFNVKSEDGRRIRQVGSRQEAEALVAREGGTIQRLDLTTASQKNYTSTHFPDVPNYVAHMRTNERDGGLFIEELQSDRHQAGRKQGYREDGGKQAKAERLKAIQPRLDELNREFINGRTTEVEDAERAELIAEKNRIQDELGGVTLRGGNAKGIPDAPFRTTWPLALFKRALRDAVASGKEWIGWTTGRTQSDRFDLSKQIRELAHIKNENGTYDVIAVTLEDEQIVKQGLNESQLEEFIGKEVGQKVVNGEGSPSPASKMKVLSGLDLKTESKGMIGFYDNMLPKEIGKYVKQWGGKVEKSDVFTTNKMGTPEYVPIWRIDITPAMREGVSQGQALFQPISEPTVEQTPDTLRETVIGFLPDGFTLDDLDINFDQLTEDVSDTDPVNAEELIRSAVNYEVARVAAERELGDDYDPMFAETYYKLLTGNLPDADKAFYIGNPNAMERLIRFLTSALRRLTTAIELQFDRHTATAVNRISRALVDAERGFRVRPDYVMMGGDVTRMQPDNRDADYLAAVQRGDMETAQRMVDEAARAAGYDMKAYHGTRKTFNEFDDSVGVHIGTKEQAEFRLKDTSVRGGEPRVIPIVAQARKPLRMNDVGKWEEPARIIPQLIKLGIIDNSTADRIRREAKKYADDAFLMIKEELDFAGYDSIVYSNKVEGKGDSYLLLNSSQIKSADPVTYDSNGNVIPLSQRFDTGSNDIRFQPILAPDNRISHFQDVYMDDPQTDADADTGEPRNWFQRMFVDRDDLARPLSKLFLNRRFSQKALESTLKNNARDFKLIQKKTPADLDLVSRALPSNRPTLTKADTDRINAEFDARLADLWTQESAAIAARENTRDEQLKASRRTFRRAGMSDPRKLGTWQTEYEKRDRQINSKAKTDIAAISADYRVRREQAMEQRKLATVQARLARADEMRRESDLALEELEKVNPDMAQWVIGSRMLIDDAQSVVKSVYGESPQLQMLIDATRGAYMVRTYRIHQDPGYAKKFLTDPKYRKAYSQLVNYFEDQLVEQEKENIRRMLGEGNFEITEEEITNSRVKNKAEKLKRLSKGENYNDADIEAIARAEVQDQAKTIAEDWIMGHGDSQTLVPQGSSSSIKVDFTRFLEKKDLDPVLLEALGEITDPVFNTTRTIESLATIAQNRKFLAAYVRTGTKLGNLISKEEYESNPSKYRGWDTLVGKDERNPAYAPLSGYYAPPEHILAFDAVRKQNRTVPTSTAGKAFDRVNRVIMGSAGWSLAFVVMGNTASAVRNIFGGGLLASRQGIVAAMTAPFKQEGRAAYRAVYEAIFDPVSRKVNTDVLNEYIALGVILNGVDTNYLREMYEQYGSDQETLAAKIQELVAKGSKNAAEKFGKVREGTSAAGEYIGKIWEFTETLYNVVVFENELGKLREAGFGTEQQMKQEAADRMRMLLPSHSEQSQGVREFTKSPVAALVAPFIRFKTDMIRTTVNTYRLAIKDMKSGNPVLAKYGRERLASALAVDAVLTAIVPQIMQAVMGIGDDEDEAIRSAMPDYAKNSNFIYYLDRSTGELTTWDLTYLNPMSFVIDPFVNMYRAVASGDAEEIPAIAAQTVGQEFLGENVLAGLVIDVKRNKDQTTGKSIYLDTDTDAEKIRKSLAHVVGGAYTPAVAKVLSRTLDAATRDQESDQFFFSPVGQAMNLFLPVKPRAQFVQDMAYRSFSETRAMNAQLWQTMSASRSPRPMDSSEIADMYQARVDGTLRVWSEFYNHAKGFEKLGMTRSEILATARRAGLSSDRTRQVVTRGTTDRPVESAEALEKMRLIDPERVRVYLEQRDKTARNLNVTGK